MLAATNQKQTTKKNTSRTNTGSSTKRNTAGTNVAKKKTTKKGNTTKGKTSSRTNRSSSRKNKKEEPMNMAMVREAIMLAVSAVAILFLLCNFGLCGKFGTIFRSLMFGLFGITAYVFPILLFLGVLFWVSNIGSGKAKVKLIAAVVVYIAVCAVLQQISFPYEKDTGLLECYTFSAEKHQGGGWIGALLGHIFVPFIGALGMHILMMALILAGFVLITEKSLVGSMKKQGSRIVQAATEDTQRLVKAKRAYREEKQQQVRVNRKGRGVASAAIFTLDESGVTPEIQVSKEEPYEEQIEYTQEEELSYQEQEGYFGQANRSDSEQINDMEGDFLYSQQVGNMGQKETLYQEQMGYMGQAEPLYQRQVGYTEQMGNGRDMPYQETENLQYEEDMLQNPLETFTRVPEEKYPQDMTIYQNVIADAGIGVDIPPEMVPFPIIGRDYETLVEGERKEQQRAEWIIEDKRTEEKKKEDIDRKQNMDWNILDSYTLTKQEKTENLDKKNFSEDKENLSFSENKEKEKQDSLDEDILSETDLQDLSDETERFCLEYAETKTEAESDIEKNPIVSEIGDTEELPVIEYKFPSLSLLTAGKQNRSDQQQEVENQMIAQKLETTLRSFGVGVTVTDVTSGPTVTRYELLPDQGVKVSRIVGLADDIKLSLAAADIRIEAPIPGKSAVGIEVPNKEVATVMLRDLLESKTFQEHPSQLAFAVGKDIEGKTIVTDIAKMPHALIAGATGSGKSVCINTLIISILYKAHPDDVKLIMIDPKVVELSIYNGIPHLLIPVVTDPKKAAGALNWAVAEMTDRYNKFSEWNVRNIQGYNEKVEELKEEEEEGLQKMPQIVIIIDELADLMMVASNEVEEAICRLAQLARAAGIHLIIATQRPSVNVITGLIKANIPSRIAFAVSSGVDSRTILDTVGAEKLLGRGDMLFAPYGASSPTRIQGAFVSDSEVNEVVEFLKGQEGFKSQSAATSKMMSTIVSGAGSEGGSMGRDDYFIEAGRLILQNERASIGMLQRKFKIGFNRAARIMDQLADAGVVGPEEGTKPRKVLMSLEEFEDAF